MYIVLIVQDLILLKTSRIAPAGGRLYIWWSSWRYLSFKQFMISFRSKCFLVPQKLWWSSWDREDHASRNWLIDTCVAAEQMETVCDEKDSSSRLACSRDHSASSLLCPFAIMDWWQWLVMAGSTDEIATGSSRICLNAKRIESCQQNRNGDTNWKRRTQTTRLGSHRKNKQMKSPTI